MVRTQLDRARRLWPRSPGRPKTLSDSPAIPVQLRHQSPHGDSNDYSATPAVSSLARYIRTRSVTKRPFTGEHVISGEPRRRASIYGI
jgi:hypothetical protein